MKNIALFILLLALIAGCANGKGNKGPDESIPACVREQTSEFDKQPNANTPIQVDEYLYMGKQVFLFTADCCDQFNMLYDENCKSLCAPSGGYTGGGDGKCKDFKDSAKLVRMIWKKEKK
ncbi:MAG: hypothetical protein ABIR30_07315 [Chitinophagaceae bacterium]